MSSVPPWTFDDRRHDRQPHAGALVRAGPFGADAPERLGERTYLVGVKHWSTVLDDEVAPCGNNGGGDAGPAAGLVVPDGIVDDVVDQAGEQQPAAGDPGVRAVVVYLQAQC